MPARLAWRIQLSPGGRAIGFLESEVDAYIEAQIARSRAGDFTCAAGEVFS